MTKRQWKHEIRKWSIVGLLAACTVCAVVSCFGKGQTGEREKGKWKQQMGSFLGNQMENMYFLLPRYLEEQETQKSPAEKIEDLLLKQIPVYDYYLSEKEPLRETEDEVMAKLILRQEGLDEDQKNIEEEGLDYREDAIHIENSFLEEMERENSLHNSDTTEQTDDQVYITQEEPYHIEDTDSFSVPEYPAYSYDWSENWDYEALISNFFAVDKSTSLQEEYLSLDRLLYRDLSVDRAVEGPQILIYHTHAHEDFADSIDGDADTTIVGAGDKLAALLEEKYGFRVLHHKGVYDEDRADAYAKSLPAIEQLLAENPTIEVVIDLHRDEMATDRKLVMDLQGKPTARFMFFNGLSYTKKGGAISYLENPYIQENLAFSFQAQVAANEYYPGIARKVYLKAYRYNMHLKPKSMLIELGAQNNTVEEIMNACDPLAHILAIVLGGMV